MRTTESFAIFYNLWQLYGFFTALFDIVVPLSAATILPVAFCTWVHRKLPTAEKVIFFLAAYLLITAVQVLTWFFLYLWGIIQAVLGNETDYNSLTALLLIILIPLTVAYCLGVYLLGRRVSRNYLAN